VKTSIGSKRPPQPNNFKVDINGLSLKNAWRATMPSIVGVAHPPVEHNAQLVSKQVLALSLLAARLPWVLIHQATISLIVYGKMQLGQVAIGAMMAFLSNLQLHPQQVVRMHILIAETITLAQECQISVSMQLQLHLAVNARCSTAQLAVGQIIDATPAMKTSSIPGYLDVIWMRLELLHQPRPVKMVIEMQQQAGVFLTVGQESMEKLYSQ